VSADAALKPKAVTSITRFGPALMAATAFAFTDIAGKFVLTSGVDVLTMAVARGLIGIAMVAAWLTWKAKPAPMDQAAKWLTLGMGVIFAFNLFFLFKAVETVNVSIAIVVYFIYPLLTGLAASAAGLDRTSWRGIVAALVAFAGLALLIGAHPGELAYVGLVCAVLAACCRVAMLLITRARLGQASPMLIGWYSILSSTVVLALALGWTIGTGGHWQLPASPAMWLALFTVGITTTIGILGVYASTARIGPFHTALLMNLEPLLATLGGVALLGETLSLLQVVGGAAMLLALLSFQMRR
jgi:probable blue pigment (indigoidine) exporter